MVVKRGYCFVPGVGPRVILVLGCDRTGRQARTRQADSPQLAAVCRAAARGGLRLGRAEVERTGGGKDRFSVRAERPAVAPAPGQGEPVTTRNGRVGADGARLVRQLAQPRPAAAGEPAERHQAGEQARAGQGVESARDPGQHGYSSRNLQPEKGLGRGKSGTGSASRRATLGVRAGPAPAATARRGSARRQRRFPAPAP